MKTLKSRDWPTLLASYKEVEVKGILHECLDTNRGLFMIRHESHLLLKTMRVVVCPPAVKSIEDPRGLLLRLDYLAARMKLRSSE